MRSAILLSVLVLSNVVFTPRVYGKGSLDLPDIFVWGEDKSVLPGIGENDRFFYPYLNRSSFLPPITIADPDKLNPKEEPVYSLSGLKAYAGYGAEDEYLLRVLQGKCIRDNWYYHYDIMGNKRAAEGMDFDYRDTRAGFDLGKKYSIFTWYGGVSGMTSETDFEKDIWKGDAGCSVSVLKTELNTDLALKSMRASGITGEQMRLGFDTRIPFLYSDYFIPNISISKISVEKAQTEYSEFELKYVNTLFRDFSLTADIGYRNRFGNRFVGGCRVTGMFIDYGYSVYFKRGNRDMDLYRLNVDYPYLRIEDLFEPQKYDSFGMSFSRKIPRIARANLDFKISRTQDHIAVINSDNGLFLHNIPKEVDIAQLSASLEREWVSVSVVLREYARDIPYDYSELRFNMFPELRIFPGFPVKIRSDLSYITKHDTWRDTEGELTTRVDPYFLWNMEVLYKLTDILSIKVGGENLLQNKVLLPGWFQEDELKLYMFIVLSINENKKRSEL
ncbi:hypothetical protein ACFLTD_03920 [Elusimicrobiota bacterium]